MSLRLEILRGPKDPLLLSKSAASDRATILSFCRHEIAHAGDAGKKQGVLRPGLEQRGRVLDGGASG